MYSVRPLCAVEYYRVLMFELFITRATVKYMINECKGLGYD